MPFAIADAAHLGPATAAARDLSAILSANVGWLDPLAALPRRAVQTILGRILCELAIPRLLKLAIKQTIHVFERNVFLRTTLRGHVLWICNGQLEDAFQAGPAHGMSAFQLSCLGERHVAHANHTVDPVLY